MEMLSWDDAKPVPVDASVRFVRRIESDGRPLRCEVTLEHSRDEFVGMSARLYGGDGQLGAEATALGRVVSRDRLLSSSTKTERILATLLFVDIVGSTEKVVRIGDAGWNAALEEQKLTVRREVSRYSGVEVATAGDGFFARFDSPVRAIEAARAIRAASASRQISIRAGVHTGECEIRGNTLAGIAVHLAARIQDAADADEILVSSTVRDLVAGSGIEFFDRGEHELKGIPDARRLYAVANP